MSAVDDLFGSGRDLPPPWQDVPPDPVEVVTWLNGEIMELEMKRAARRAMPPEQAEYVPISPEDPNIRVAVAAVLDEYEVDFLLCTLTEVEQLLLALLTPERGDRP